MRTRLNFIAFVGIMLSLPSFAHAISCGTEPPDSRFDAVCAIQRRTVAFDESWRAEASGVLVAPNLIVTVRHYLDQNTPIPANSCTIQQDAWYAYFRVCPPPPSGTEQCFPVCTAGNEDYVRVRIKCFRLAAGEFYYPPVGQTQGYVDAVVVAEIEPDDVCSVSHITPMQLSSPFNLSDGLDLCIGHPVQIAGWGNTVNAQCQSVTQQRLLVGTASIASIACPLTTGRHGSIMLSVGSCDVEKDECGTRPNTGDSGGAVAVEMPDSSLRLIGVFKTPTEAFFAAEHQSLTPSPGTAYLCRPCRKRPCGDINGDGFENLSDRTALISQGAHDVACWCLGDMNGNGCSGDSADVSIVNGHL